MNIRRILCAVSAAGVCALLAAPALAAQVVIGVPAWPSAQVTANIIAKVLKSDLGVDAKLDNRGTLGILAGIDQGTIHIHPEVWLPNLADAVERYADQNGTLRLASRAAPAAQNICVTSETVELTGIEDVKDLTNPEMASHFDSDGDGKGEMWIGAPSWSSTPIEKIRARSYGYDKTMSLLEAPEEVAMAAVDVAESLGRPIVFYCYKPHHVFKLHDIRLLAEPAHDPATWTILSQADDPSWMKNSKAGSAWDTSSYHIGYAASLEASDPSVVQVLERISFSADDATAMSYAVEVEGKAPADVAETWIS
jgi:glycine betaine/proline transport system substrate-binding protein